MFNTLFNTKVYYIHGFGSTTESPTIEMLRKEFPDAVGLDYDHNDPELSISLMFNEIIANDYFKNNVVIIGSSLGGWYAEQLTKYIVADYILYNPATQPEFSLGKYGVEPIVLEKYDILSRSSNNSLPVSNRTVILCSDDLVIDPKFANIKYKDRASMIYTTGSHRMTEDNMQIIVSRIKYLQNQLP